MLSRLPRPAIIAHRGSSAHAPENTLAAFELAVEQGADAIELDAKLSADGQVVVIHDLTVDRTTQGKGPVRSFTLEALKQLDAGSSFDIAFKGEKIPTLEEVFEAVGKKIYINVELTNLTTPFDALPNQVAELVKRHGLKNKVFFSSFNPFNLVRMRKLLPDSPLGLLALPGKKGGLVRSRLRYLIPHHSLNPEAGDATPDLIEQVHASGRRVLVYTVNDPDAMHRLYEWGVDGIFTDDPVLARQVLAAIGT